jgi:CRP-like cAMP-binding protein
MKWSLSLSKLFGSIVIMSAITKIYQTGDTLFKEGETAISLFIIKRGAISIRKTKGKNFVEIGKIGSGEVIGELSFFDHHPRSATAVALMEVVVIEVTFEALEKIYNTIPDYMKTIAAAMAGRLRTANEKLRQLQSEKHS